MLLQVIPMPPQRLDGRQQVIGQRIDDLHAQLDVAPSVPVEADRAVGGVLTLAVVPEAARPAAAEDADVVADLRVLVFAALETLACQLRLGDRAWVIQAL